MSHLLIANVFRVEADGFFHGSQTKDLHQMVLNDVTANGTPIFSLSFRTSNIPTAHNRIAKCIARNFPRSDKKSTMIKNVSSPDDAVLVEIAATSLGANRLLERDHDAGHVVIIPGWGEDPIGKSIKRESQHHSSHNWKPWEFNQSINRTINQSSDRTIAQSDNQSINRLDNQSINQLKSRSIGRNHILRMNTWEWSNFAPALCRDSDRYDTFPPRKRASSNARPISAMILNRARKASPELFDSNP